MDARSLYAYNYYLQRGYSPSAAAGIVGNLRVESGGFADDVLSGARRGDSGTAFGAPQLRGERLANFQNYAKEQGADPRSLPTQLGFVDHEMRTGLDAGAGQAYKLLQNVQNPADAAHVFMTHYERPNADPSINQVAQRQQYANSLAGVPQDTLPATYQQNLPPATDPTGAGIASLAGAAGTALPTVQEAAASDPMSGVFGLLLQAQMQQPQVAPVAAAAPVQRKPVDNRGEEEKLASVSQTPNVYYDRMRRSAING